MLLELENMEKSDVYHVLTQVVVPRPVAWVLSSNDQGSLNLAPFSYFSAVCSDPPLIMLSIGSKPDSSPKDTYANIVDTEKFVIHIAGSDLATKVTHSSVTLPRGESEIELCDLETVEVEGFTLPRVVGPKIAMSCSLYQQQEIGNAPQRLIFGRIEKIWLDDAVVEMEQQGRPKIDAALVDPLARLGGSDYQTFGDVVTVPRPA